jgi:hypothetical protein
MDTNYQYRLLLPGIGWGIAIDLSGRLEKVSSVPEDAYQVDDRIFLLLDELQRPPSIIQELCTGIALMKATIMRDTPENANACLVLSELSYNLCDFQENGLVWATAGLVAKILGVGEPQVDWIFDNKCQYYVCFSKA